MSDEVKTPPPAMKFGTIVVEVGNDRNGTVRYEPTQANLRGRFSPHNMGPGATSISKNIDRMPAFPGLHLRLDLRAGTLRITDPLAKPENAKLLERMTAVARGADQIAENQSWVAVPEVLKEKMDVNERASHLYAVLKMVNRGDGTVISGQMPEDEADILKAFPGCVIRKDYNESVRAREA